MQLLSQQEQMTAASAAHKFARTIVKDEKDGCELGYETLFKNAAAVEVLYLSCLDADAEDEGLRPAFQSPSRMRELLTHVDVAELMGMYLDLMDETYPEDEADDADAA